MGLYNYISRYLYFIEIPFETMAEKYGKDYEEVCEMQNRLKQIEPKNELFLIILNTNLEFNYHNYILNTEVPNMKINTHFQIFCNKWEDIYKKTKTRLLKKFFSVQFSFKKKLYNPHTKLGYNFMIKKIDELYED